MRTRISSIVLGLSLGMGVLVSCGPPPDVQEPDEVEPVKSFKHCPMEMWGWGAEYEAKIIDVITDEECNPSDRKDAVARAGDMRINDAVAPLFAIIESDTEDQALRIEAITAMGNFGTRRVLRPFEKLLDDPDPQVSTAAAKALAQLTYMGDRYAIHLMKELAADDSKGDLKAIAVVALGRSGKFFVADELIELLASDQPTVRGEAAEALGIVADLRAVEPLIALLKDEDQTVRTKACQALGQIGDQRASQPLLDVAKNDVERYVRSDAAYALGLLADESVLPELVQILKDADESERWGYQYAVSQYGNLAFDTAVELMQSKKKALRQVAVNIFSRIRDTRSREYLIQALSDSSEDVRSAAAWSLGQYGGKEVADALLARYQKEKVENVRSALLRTMGDVGDKKFEKTLIEASREEAARLKADAIYALQSYMSDAAFDAVLEALESESEFVREAAARSLGFKKSPDGAKPLLALLEDDHAWVRMSAIESLGEMGDRSVIPEIAKLADDKDERVRSTVLRALGALGGDEAMEILIAGLDDEKEIVREQAIRSLGRILSEREVSDLGPFFVAFNKGLSDDDYYVRRAAASHLSDIRVPFPEGVQKGLLGALDMVDDYALEDIIWALSRVDDKGIADELLGFVEASEFGVDMTLEQAIATMDAKLVEERLIELSASEDVLTKATASMALAYLGSTQAQEILLSQLESENGFTRRIAAGALGVCGDAQAAAPLTGLLADADEDVVLEAIYSLGEIGRRNAGSVDVDKLIAKLEDDNPRVKSEAATALGYIGDTKATARLLELFKEDATKLKSLGCGIRCGVVAQYGYALGLLGDDDATLEVLIEMIKDPHPRTRGEAARVLASIASGKAVKELTEAVKSETDLIIRDSLIDALAMTKSPKAVPVLKGLLKDADVYTTVMVLHALGRTGGSKEAKLVSGYLDHHNIGIRSAAIEALGRLGAKSYLPDIVKFVGDPRYPWIQTIVYEALVRIGDAKGCEQALGDIIRDSDRRQEVIMAGLTAAALQIEPLRPAFEKRLKKFMLGGKLADIVAYLFGDEDKGNELYNWLLTMRIPRGNAMIAEFIMVAFQYGGEQGHKYIAQLESEAFAQFIANSARRVAKFW